jgi:HJR/Mrr/RecB family endonuclease
MKLIYQSEIISMRYRLDIMIATRKTSGSELREKKPAFLANMGYVEASTQPSTQSHNQGGRS